MYKIMVAIITTFIGIYSSQCLADASGCIVLDGKTYTLNLSSIAIDQMPRLVQLSIQLASIQKDQR